jgi:hypothetical protein
MSKRAERKTPGKPLTNYSNKFSNSFTEYSGYGRFRAQSGLR